MKKNNTKTSKPIPYSRPGTNNSREQFKLTENPAPILTPAMVRNIQVDGMQGIRTEKETKNTEGKDEVRTEGELVKEGSEAARSTARLDQLDVSHLTEKRIDTVKQINKMKKRKEIQEAEQKK